MKIRKIEKKDYSQIKQLYQEEEWLSFLRVDFELAIEHSISLVAYENDKILGFLRALSDGYITIFIGEIIVRKDVRKQGIGKALITAVHSMYPTARIDLISEADQFYQENGFKKIGTGMRKFKQE